MVNFDKPEDYLAMASEDAKICGYLLEHYEEVPTGVCFHAQQCLEKLLKQVFRDNGLKAPRTHELSSLLVECYERGFLSENVDLDRAAEFLKMFATKARYVPLDASERGEVLAAVLHLNRASKALADQGYQAYIVKTRVHFLDDEDPNRSKEGDSLQTGYEYRYDSRDQESEEQWDRDVDRGER